MSDELYRQAIGRFGEWLEDARASGTAEPTAMTLATARREGGVSARTVLLKEVDERGFVFYTNLNSRKGRQLNSDPRCALVFLWAHLKRQVLVEGRVEPVAPSEADAYWATRPRGSQFGAWASRQSETLDSRETLESRFHELEREYTDRQIPRPEHWSGFRVVPERIEFWSGRDSRLHDRERYRVQSGTWIHELLYP